MDRITALPLFVRAIFNELPKVFRGQHKLIMTWLVTLIALGIGDHKLTKMADKGSSFVKEWKFRRLLTASYWSIRKIIYWLVDEIVKTLPQPVDATIYLIADGSKKEKRSKKNPYMQKGKIRTGGAWFFGIRFCVLLVCWGNYRIPVDYEILYPKGHKKYRNENKLFRAMIKRFRPPVWAKQVIVLGDAAYGSTKNMKAIIARGKKDLKEFGVEWYFCFAQAKTIKFSDNKSLKDLVRHLIKKHYKRTNIPPLKSGRNKCYWTFCKKVDLRNIGEVTIVLSKKRRNSGPKSTKVIVTNLPNASAKTVLSIYQRRFMIEVLFRELKSGLGLGKQQVTKDEIRIKNSIGCSILAYLLLLKAQSNDIRPNKSWSIFMLKENFKYRVFRQQAANDYKKVEMKNAA